MVRSGGDIKDQAARIVIHTCASYREEVTDLPDSTPSRVPLLLMWVYRDHLYHNNGAQLD